MTFDTAFDRLISHEGGLSMDPDDPGNWTGGEPGAGELRGTNWGISAATYPHLDIANLTRDDARDIYRRDFWSKVHGDKLHDGVAFQLFDFAVNSGIGTAIRKYQRALGVADDGIFGGISQAAAASMSESDQIMRVLAERLDYMTRLKNWQHASRGWARRIAHNLRFGADDS